MRLRAWVMALLLLLPLAAAACPTCKDAFGNTPQTAGLAKGFYYSIFFMLSAVFGMVGLLIFKIVKEARKQPPAPPVA